MKALIFVFSIFCCAASWAQAPQISSQVYHWKDIKLKKSAAFGKNVLFKGSTRDLDYLEVSGYVLKPGKTQGNFSDGMEHLVIVKDGTLHVKIKGSEKALDPGSIAMAMPGDPLTLSNSTGKDIYYYVFSYKSKAPVDMERGEKAGGSFMVDWNDLVFRKQDKGGTRQYFKRPTAMCDVFDMHVTTLNPGLKSHDPHTHRAAEIILMMDGDTEEQIGDRFYKGSNGDVYFMKSEILHGIQNIGSKPAVYFAIQWQ